jgi:hypothetical protein
MNIFFIKKIKLEKKQRKKCFLLVRIFLYVVLANSRWGEEPLPFVSL